MSSQPHLRKCFLLIHEGRPANVAGNNTTPDALIQLIGAINPAAEHLESYKPISVESMVAMQPDIILVSGRSYQELGGPQAVLKNAITGGNSSRTIVVYSPIDGKALVGGLGLMTLSEAHRVQALIYPQQ